MSIEREREEGERRINCSSETHYRAAEVCGCVRKRLIIIDACIHVVDDDNETEQSREEKRQIVHLHRMNAELINAHIHN